MSKGAADRDIAVYGLARKFLLNVDSRVTEEILSQSTDHPFSATDMETLFRQLLESARSPHMKFSVIGEIDALKAVLYGFSPRQVAGVYGTDAELLLDQIVAKARPSGQVRRTCRSIWPQFCKTILSGAAFLSQFESAEDFTRWVGIFDRDDRTRPALPMLLAQEIHGLGFALGCDFLKELGFVNFCKPDVHLKRILPALQVSQSDDDYEIFKTVVRIARSTGKRPYEVDKVFWIIGSGWIDKDVSIGKQGDAFVRFAQERLDRLSRS